ncbi:MAG: hypothetical protein L0G94_20075 [Brachybacterium sp.]|uniref:hypothetical protein n=1 Tax=Brachybacterium sp. TaxID=1891286 RepID=UPI002649ECF4|nr:hypothetical protein [Brachybacterium sp.]MDN5688954.1 hypothetical protein [Brachybacterium sp.]
MHSLPRALPPALIPSSARLWLMLLAGIAALFALAACGEVDDTTEIGTDGSGTQTLAVTVTDTDMERIDGGAATVEATIEENNPGLNYVGMEKNGTDTIFTMTLEFTDAEDYAAKAQPVLAAGDLTKTAEVTFTPPSPPFSSGYTLTRNFTPNDLTRWVVKALVEDGNIEDAEEGQIDSAIDEGDVTVTVDGDELEKQMGSFGAEDSAPAWSNAESAGFGSVKVVTAGADDPAADSFTRTITYDLDRSVYLDAKDEFDAFFEEATPEGGELKPAGDAGTEWVITFPAGTAEQVGTWTDAALATEGSTFTVETAPSEDDPFVIETRVVDDIECTAACGENGTLEQALLMPVDKGEGTEEVSLDGGPEPQVIRDEIVFTEADYDLTVNRDGGGKMVMALSLPAEDDAVVTEENVVAFLGADADRSESDGTVIYTLRAEADDSEEFTGALQKLGLEGADGPPLVSVTDRGDGSYAVSLELGAGSDLISKLGEDATWTIHGDGLRPTSILSDEAEVASLGDDAVTAKGEHGVVLTFAAERAGLGIGGIVAIVAGLAVLGLLIAAAVIAFLHREKLSSLLRGTPATGPAVAPGGGTGPAQNPAQGMEESRNPGSSTPPNTSS